MVYNLRIDSLDGIEPHGRDVGAWGPRSLSSRITSISLLAKHFKQDFFPPNFLFYIFIRFIQMETNDTSTCFWFFICSVWHSQPSSKWMRHTNHVKPHHLPQHRQTTYVLFRGAILEQRMMASERPCPRQWIFVLLVNIVPLYFAANQPISFLFTEREGKILNKTTPGIVDQKARKTSSRGKITATISG